MAICHKEEKKQDYITKLLSKRFNMLCEWKIQGKLEQYERKLGSNKIALIYNASEEELDCLFGKTNEEPLENQIQSVILLLQKRFTDNKEYQQTLQEFLDIYSRNK